MKLEEAWAPLGRVAPSALGSARLHLHWAAQIVAAAGQTWIEPRPDSSHTALTWIEFVRGFAGEPLANGARALLLVDELVVTLVGAGGTLSDERFPLANRTLDEGLSWLAGAIARLGGAPARKLVRPVHELPPGPLAQGGSFERAPDALRELGNWYANGAQLLGEVSASQAASPVRCWPHHFDIATLIALDAGPPGEHARTIGVGLSPGDGSYAEPYWYVTPWPYPKAGRETPLPVGHWHTSGWFGGVLTAGELFAGGPAAQAPRVRAFVESAIAACRLLLA